MSRANALSLAAFAGLALVPFAVHNSYYVHMITVVLVFAIVLFGS